MTFEMKEGQVFLFENFDPTENHPRFKGSVMIKGEKLEIALWPAKSGKPGAYSGKVSEEWKKPEEKRVLPDAAPAVTDDMDDSIPF